MPHLRQIESFLNRYLRIDQYAEERNGALAEAARQVRRLGIALEPAQDLRSWIEVHGLDAVLFHRAWGVEPSHLPPATGILQYHLPFDDHLTPGYSPPLADALGLRDVEPLGSKRGRAVGMIGALDQVEFHALVSAIQREFGALEDVVQPGRKAVRRMAVMGAMNDALVREAAERGADVYLTGQLRVPARLAVGETGIGVITTGHRRAEQWGLRALARLLQEQWHELEIVLHT